MKHQIAAVVLACAVVSASGSPRTYIEPQSGFESYISAAIVKKRVPVVVTRNPEEAQFVLASTVLTHTEGYASQITRCLFLHCIGANGSQTATVQLIDARTQEVVWAYNVEKPDAGAYRSTAEAISKHLREFLEKHLPFTAGSAIFRSPEAEAGVRGMPEGVDLTPYNAEGTLGLPALPVR